MRPAARFSRFTALALTVGVMAVALLPARVSASPVPWGTVLVPGCSWAGAVCASGDFNVYSNGTGNEDRMGSYGMNYECMELVTRYAQIRFGDLWYHWGVNSAYQMWNAGPSVRPIPFTQLANGGGAPPQFGDIMVFNQTSYDPWGHVAIVAGTGPGYVDIVEQNWANSNPTGQARLPISGTTMPPRWGLTILGWLRAAGQPGTIQGNSGPGGFTADGYGDVYPYGSMLPVAQVASWPNWDIVRGMTHIHGTDAGFILDAFGGVHPFGAGAPWVGTTGYWRGWDIVRGIAMRPDGQAGYVLDAFGGLHPFSAAGVPLPPIPVTAYWPGWDIARGVVLRADGVSGYTLDGFGGIHPFGGAPFVSATAYWPGWAIARGMTLRSDGVSGWVLDGLNGLHPFGGAPWVNSSAYFPDADVARGITTLDDGGGYTVTAWGRVREFGDAPGVVTGVEFADPVARGVG